ncbi:MAG: sulfurtransferase [Deltaproteobacteria bacterium]|nr:sulfurtransferase [Deltaproteobacteria bacterium]
MKWKQFFTPVKSISADEAKKLLSGTSLSDMNILDVRQPKEYEEEHIPGAKLIPIADLNSRLSELDPDKPTLVYCAIGGRSRVAAQMLAGKDFSRVLNLTGGIKAWNGEKAIMGEEKGMELFTGNESLEETLVIAYGLELGLEEFYISMIETSKLDMVKEIFRKLAKIEVNHMDRIFNEYIRFSHSTISQEEFAAKQVVQLAEGGMTTEEYIKYFNPDPDSPRDVIETAMSIEAQALDLYFRASERVKQDESRKFLAQMAEEERTHLKQLGNLMDTLITERSLR